MNKYINRVTSSQRGEVFNPLIWPFLLTTFAYGIGFTVFLGTPGTVKSSLYLAMYALGHFVPLVWGIVAVVTIVMGLSFLLFNIPPAGKVSGLVGFMVWVFASFCWLFSGNILLIFALGAPNMWFWIWQYLSLSFFRDEDAEDKKTMKDYNAGFYDDDNGGKELRLNNRGVDRQ